MNNEMYRLVSDFGYGDKCWLERWLSLDDALKELAPHRGYSKNDKEIPLLGEAQDSSFTYYIERDNYGDTEDWDWMDS